MASYFAKATAAAMGSGERLIAVTGTLQGGLLRVVDVDIQGNPIGRPSYLPANAIISELVIGPAGTLIEGTAEVADEQEIDWEAHESRTGAIEENEKSDEEESIVSDGKINPALAAFPNLQG